VGFEHMALDEHPARHQQGELLLEERHLPGVRFDRTTEAAMGRRNAAASPP
jgi:hypothetical protein